MFVVEVTEDLFIVRALGSFPFKPLMVFEIPVVYVAHLDIILGL